MKEPTKLAIDAQGGLERRNRFTMLSGHRAPGRGGLGKPEDRPIATGGIRSRATGQRSGRWRGVDDK